MRVRILPISVLCSIRVIPMLRFTHRSSGRPFQVTNLLHIGGSSLIMSISSIFNPADVLIRLVLWFPRCIHFPDDISAHQNCRTPTTPTIISSIPVWNSWKIWMAPSWAILGDSADKLFSLHGIHLTHSCKNARCESGDSFADKFLSRHTDGVSNGKRHPDQTADNISCIGLVHDVAFCASSAEAGKDAFSCLLAHGTLPCRHRILRSRSA